MKLVGMALGLAVAFAPMAAEAQAAAPVAATPSATAGYTVTETNIGTLLDDPAAKAIIDKYLPGLSTNPQIDMARSMSLKTVQQYAPDKITDEALSKVQTDLSKLPAKK
ncbi:hypothetical protein EDF56_102501 [Novosphingobium sp. PhB165]|uniref:hypothetical protein n=1 Tax=Novosphingobium sp. PhB165 TaxID=2485105 RepID=UPI001046DB57|nr:hypothetical protein [Novosphingobium sp. PhB165]TCM20838.1 hypothetical protein EDF56_102501 [Novosphingobium sp. PhB165]